MTTQAEVEDIQVALRATRGCRECRKRTIELTRTMADFRKVRHLAARTPDDDRWPRLLERTEADRDGAIKRALAHLGEPHAEPAPAPAPTRVLSVVPDPAPVTHAPCPRCGAPAPLAGEGKIRAHRTRSGFSCPCRYLQRPRVDAPPVVMRVLPVAPKRTPAGKVGDPDAPRYATGFCHTCDKPVTGERHYCGRCLARRS